MAFTKDLSPPAGLNQRYRQALAILQASDRTRIGHIDTGVAEHPALGYANGQPPNNLRIHLGRDLLSPDPAAPPVTDLTVGPALADRISDFPDHGIKTLSVILSATPEFRGVAPGATVIPMRIADGPIFQDNTQRNAMGPAVEHLLGLDPVPRVISISMGNPGFVGLFQPPLSLLGQKPGFNAATRRAFDRAYEMGVIVVCAAGQVIDRVIYPARYTRTIAVGGFRRGGNEHYPQFDYDIPERVDIWAQADGINRAFAERQADGTILRGYAEDQGDGSEKISGTSYATPQVAAAATLWVDHHIDALPKPGEAEAWRTVEAFRAALVASATERGLRIRVPRDRFVTRPCLDIERLLGTAPVLPDDDAKRSPAARHTNQA
jgi:subtilisin family serine protease